MSGLKKLVLEVHRRSLWQVLAIYAAASWIVYEAIEAPEQDSDGLRRSIDFFQREMGRTSTARVAFTVKPDELVEVMSPARHHMGSTRMHVDPKHGVVDADCKMHGVANLYIAGSSVFPTGGNANPTLTLVALAFRLCDHLKQVMEV